MRAAGFRFCHRITSFVVRRLQNSCLSLSPSPGLHHVRDSTNRTSLGCASENIQETRHAAFEFRCLSRPAPSGRRASDVAVPPRSRPRGAARPARLRRVLVRRAPFERLGDDRLARDVSGRRGRAVEAHQARHRRHLIALPPPVQCRAAHGAARLDDRRAGDLRVGSGRACLGRPHARDRSDGAARSPGRGDQHHPAAVQRRAGDGEKRLVHPAGRGIAAAAIAGGDALCRRLADQPIGHDIGREARDRHHLDRVDVERRLERSADAMGLRRDGRGQARQDGRPQELACPVELAHRRDPR